MSPRTLILSRLAAALAAFGAAARMEGQIAAKSPFMAPQAAANNAPTAGAPLEFRALIETAEGVQFRLYDPAKKTGTWVKLNEKNAELEVLAKQLDEAQQPPTLTVEHQGRTLTLAMRVAKVVSSGSAAQAMPPPPAPMPPSAVPTAVTQAVVLNPTPADEQRRLEAVAAEVARRRALREQATQQIGQGVPQPAAQPPQMQPQMQGQQPRNFQQPPNLPPGMPINRQNPNERR